MSQEVLTPAQSVSHSGDLTTAESLMERIKVGYSEDSIHIETSRRWEVGENLIVPIPMGWEVGWQAERGNLLMVEFVPKGQTVENWQGLWTLQIFLDGLSKDPKQFFEDVTSLLKKICPEQDVSSVMTGKENGYPFALWIWKCPNNPQVNQAEITLFKVVQGNKNFYIVQRAWRVPKLSPQQPIPINPTELEESGRYMRLVGVCDPQIAERNCPTSSKK